MTRYIAGRVFWGLVMVLGLVMVDFVRRQPSISRACVMTSGWIKAFPSSSGIF
jgi:hypothetical protein